MFMIINNKIRQIAFLSICLPKMLLASDYEKKILAWNEAKFLDILFNDKSLEPEESISTTSTIQTANFFQNLKNFKKEKNASKSKDKINNLMIAYFDFFADYVEPSNTESVLNLLLPDMKKENKLGIIFNSQLAWAAKIFAKSYTDWKELNKIQGEIGFNTPEDNCFNLFKILFKDFLNIKTASLSNEQIKAFKQFKHKRKADDALDQPSKTIDSTDFFTNTDLSEIENYADIDFFRERKKHRSKSTEQIDNDNDNNDNNDDDDNDDDDENELDNDRIEDAKKDLEKIISPSDKQSDNDEINFLQERILIIEFLAKLRKERRLDKKQLISKEMKKLLRNLFNIYVKCKSEIALAKNISQLKATLSLDYDFWHLVVLGAATYNTDILQEIRNNYDNINWLKILPLKTRKGQDLLDIFYDMASKFSAIYTDKEGEFLPDNARDLYRDLRYLLEDHALLEGLLLKNYDLHTRLEEAPEFLKENTDTASEESN